LAADATTGLFRFLRLMFLSPAAAANPQLKRLTLELCVFSMGPVEALMTEKRRVVAVIPCNDLAASEAFYRLLGFRRHPNGEDHGDYVLLSDDGGAELHLTKAPDGWLITGKSPFGIYFYADNVEELASRLEGLLLHPPRLQPWGMFEFAVSDPDENLVRVGRGSS
jgi:catechol 2,3-dioxygenase-like lactoylglutathione lyase family enzyme